MAVTMVNNGSAKLKAGIDDTATIMTVETGKGDLFDTNFPYRLTLEELENNVVVRREIVEVTNKVQDTFTITRAVEPCPLNSSTTTQQQTPQPFSTGAVVEQRITASTIETLNDKLDLTQYNQEKMYKGESTTGTDAYAATITGATPLFDGQRFQIKCDVSNTSTATLNINGTGDKAIKVGDQGALVDIQDNTITGGAFGFFTYLAGTDEFQYTSNEGNVVLTAATYTGKELPAYENILRGDLVSIVPGASGNNAQFTAGNPSIPDSAQVTTDISIITRGQTTGRVVICDTSSGTPVFGVEQTFGTSVAGPQITEIDTNKFFIAYRDGTTLYGVVATVSGTTITLGAPVSLGTGYAPKTCNIGTDKTFVTYQTAVGSSACSGVVVSISGTVPTFNTPVSFVGASATNNSCTKLLDDKVLICYDESSGKAVIGTITGTVPSYGTPTTYDVSDGGPGETISSTKAIVFAKNTNNGYVLSISGTTITAGSAFSIPGSVSGSQITSVNLVSGEQVIVTSKAGSDAVWFLGNTEGNNIFYSDVITFETIANYGSDANLIGNNKALINYNVNFTGESEIIELTPGIKKTTATTESIVGFSVDNITNGQVGEVATSGISNFQTNLLVGQKYYVGSNPGEISGVVNGTPVGVALSDKDLLINPGVF